MVLGSMVLGSMVLDRMVLDSMDHGHSIRSQLAMRTMPRLKRVFSYKYSYLLFRVECSLVFEPILLSKTLLWGRGLKKGFTFFNTI